MIRSSLVWLSALWLGVLIHVDWHLGRPGPSHLSFGLSYHWLLAVVAFAPLPWLLRRRWPDSLTQASVLVIALGVVMGQGFEPLGEAILFDYGPEPFTNAVRWRIFAEFLAAGILTYLFSAAITRRRMDRAAA
jgi:hypothetical protein